MKINTVYGEIDSSQLGLTLMHEHVATLDCSMVQAYPDWYDREGVLNTFAEAIARVKPFGVKTFVDQLPINLGRDIHLLRDAAARADIQLICATGVYHTEQPFICRNIDAEFMAEFFVRDLTVGIQGTPYKAALIKCATDKLWGESENNRAMLRAAAIASCATDAPIATHTYSKLHQGLYQQRIFLEAGVAPHKILIGHSFDCLEREYLTQLLDNGTYVGCDQIGILHRASTQDLAQCVADLLAMGRGYERQIMLSHDGGIVNDYAYSFARWRRDPAKNNSLGFYDELFQVMLPELRARGVTQAQIDTMLVENPRRYFEGTPLTLARPDGEATA